jgi:hypothetical protein
VGGLAAQEFLRRRDPVRRAINGKLGQQQPLIR